MNIPVKPTPIKKILFFDLEWSITKDKFKEHPILAFSYVDTEGVEKVHLIEDYLTDFNGQERTLFEAEKSLLGVILKIIEQYTWSVGFYTTGVRSYNPKKGKMEGRDSDLMQLHTRLKRHGMEEDSPIWINENNNRPYLTGKNRDHNHIDAYKLFTNKTIKTSLYKNAYSNRSLDSIGRAVVNEGKYNSLSGPVFENIKDLNEKRKYALGDCIILYKSVAKNDFVLLRIIESLSNTTKVSFRDLCNSGGISKVLTEVLDNVVYTELKNNNFDNITAEELATHREKLHYFWTTPTTFTNYNITVV